MRLGMALATLVACSTPPAPPPPLDAATRAIDAAPVATEETLLAVLKAMTAAQGAGRHVRADQLALAEILVEARICPGLAEYVEADPDRGWSILLEKCDLACSAEARRKAAQTSSSLRSVVLLESCGPAYYDLPEDEQGRFSEVWWMASRLARWLIAARASANASRGLILDEIDLAAAKVAFALPLPATTLAVELPHARAIDFAPARGRWLSLIKLEYGVRPQRLPAVRVDSRGLSRVDAPDADTRQLFLLVDRGARASMLLDIQLPDGARLAVASAGDDRAHAHMVSIHRGRRPRTIHAGRMSIADLVARLDGLAAEGVFEAGLVP